MVLNILKMTDETLEKILKTTPLNGTYLNNKTAMYLEVKIKCIEQIIVLLDGDIRVGGMFIMGDCDLHFMIFEEFRNKGYLSNFMRSKALNKIRPKLKSASICNNEEKQKIRYLLKLSGLKTCRTCKFYYSNSNGLN